MSADNYYRIFKENGRYYPVMGFMSDDELVHVQERHRKAGGFDTLRQAIAFTDRDGTEYGTTLDDSCRPYPPLGGYQTVTGVDTLNEMPLGSVILDGGGTPRQATARSNSQNIWEWGDEAGMTSAAMIDWVCSLGVKDVFLAIYIPEES